MRLTAGKSGIDDPQLFDEGGDDPEVFQLLREGFEDDPIR